MGSNKRPQRRELSIVIIEDDLLALRYETELLNRLQNYDGFHLRVWGTIKLDAGLEKCAHDPHPADAVFLELSLLDKSNRNIANEIRQLRPDTIIIGITSHFENYPQSMAKSLQLHYIVSKVSLSRKLPKIVEAIYRRKRPRHLSAVHDEQSSPPSNGQNKETHSQLPYSYEKPYCQGATKRSDKPLHGSRIPSKERNTTAFTPHRQNGIPTSRKRKRSQRSEISLSDANRAKHNRNLGRSKPVNHDLAADRHRMEAVNRISLPAVPLTPMELCVIRFTRKGLKPNQIAKQLGISVNTIYSHRSHIMAKCHAQTWSNAMFICQQANGTK
ncbi:LuxR C-terminal-related transcriptional regulator [Bifidobacterium sp. ESL0798]|uniref:LuxR C-terminal-related transcriptional regulator n=1 Tax=Bifidobacterium sp. ESL0798 TaxID=2983235 RepID=UPI0023F637E3|nr:LuxR C-terminal-related transcriptional regulator [Bifidobacterium sp. ESL0798]WEV73696.1 LuxR C-terminal-related transcriptional regulator [Bifidobacterium sp. ESL0798]